MLIVTKEEKIVGQCKSSVSKELEALECLERIKAITKVYSIDLFSEFAEDLDTIKQALTELQTIKNAKPSKVMECFKRVWNDINAHNDYRQDFNDLKNIENYILKAQEQEKLKVYICEMFGLDNLFPYNDTKAILKELEEYMNRKNQLWVDFMKTSKELKEQEKVLSIIFEKNVDIIMIRMSETLDKYNLMIYKGNFCRKEITQEEFNLLKEVL